MSLDAFNIWITRPAAQSALTRDKLRGALQQLGGCSIYIEPLSEIVYFDDAIDNLAKLLQSEPYNIITTSRHAITNISQALGRCPNRDEIIGYPLYVVGESSLRLARELGFMNIKNSDVSATNATELLHLLERDIAGRQHDDSGSACCSGKYLYVRAENVSLDICKHISDYGDISSSGGITCDEIVTYKAVFCDDLSDRFKEIISSSYSYDGKGSCRARNIILLYSRLSAQNFCNLLNSNGLSRFSDNLYIVSISEKVSQVVERYGSVPHSNIFAASSPNEDSMIEALLTILPDIT